MEQENFIPQDLIIYFSDIAERLRNGKASVIVGAGFSLNAKRKNNSTKEFPDWKKLGDIFYEKLNQKKPSEANLNVLKLAQEIEVRFDRPTLDELLLNSIPDDEYSPSELHQKFLVSCHS